MKLSTGKVRLPLEFDNGDVEYVMINPYDPKLQERIKGFEASISARIKNLNFEKYKEALAEDLDLGEIDFENLINLPQEDLEKIAKQTEVLAQIDKEIEAEFCAELDAIFDDNVSEKAFKYVSPLATVPGEDGESEVYLVLVLKALAVEIQKCGKNLNSINNKYTEKYPKVK